VDWRTSSYSGAQGGQCVELASGGGAVLVRDTTDRDGGTLAFTAAAWQAFTGGLKTA
jgi:Domain of unknown function (DUF397)